MTTAIVSTTLETLTANIKLKLVENQVATNIFNRTVNQNSVEIGQWLTQAKKLINHGQWQNWLTGNFNMTDRTARNYMKLAAYFGVNGIIKTEDVFRFQPYALLELTKLTADEVKKFLKMQTDEGVELSTLSVRNLREAIQQWKKTEVSTVKKEITAADIRQYFKAQFPVFNLPATKLLKAVESWKETRQAPEVLKLPPPSFNQLPFELIDAADLAHLRIEMQFGRGLDFPLADGVVVTRQNSAAIKKFSTVADCVIFAAPLSFIRNDAITKKLKPLFGISAVILITSCNFFQHSARRFCHY